jgi:hypothetical protein
MPNAELMRATDGSRPCVVGLLASEKKFRTFFNNFMKHCEGGSAGITCVPLSMSAASACVAGEYPSPWSNVDVILHKLSDDIAAAAPFDLETADDATMSMRDPVDFLPVDGSGVGLTDERRAFHSPLERSTSYRTVQTVLSWKLAAEARRVVFEGPRCVALTTRRTATHRALAVALSAPSPPGAARVSLPFMRVVHSEDEEATALAMFRDHRSDALVKSDVACGKSSTHHMRFVAATANSTPLSTPTELNQPGSFRERNAEASNEGDRMRRHGSNGSSNGGRHHRRAIHRVGKDEGFAPVAAPPLPRVVQRTVTDADVVVKVYVLGGTVSVRVIRNGIPWIPEAAATGAWFSSQNDAFFPVLQESVALPSAATTDALDGVDTDVLSARVLSELAEFSHAAPLHDTLRGKPDVLHAVVVTARRIRKVFGLSMFGFDLAIGRDVSAAPDAPRTSTGAAEERPVVHVIDVNYFPGYKGITDLNNRVASLILDAHRRAICSVENLQEGRA